MHMGEDAEKNPHLNTRQFSVCPKSPFTLSCSFLINRGFFGLGLRGLGDLFVCLFCLFVWRYGNTRISTSVASLS